jgi:hypothetical protein
MDPIGKPMTIQAGVDHTEEYHLKEKEEDHPEEEDHVDHLMADVLCYI